MATEGLVYLVVIKQGIVHIKQEYNFVGRYHPTASSWFGLQTNCSSARYIENLMPDEAPLIVNTLLFICLFFSSSPIRKRITAATGCELLPEGPKRRHNTGLPELYNPSPDGSQAPAHDKRNRHLQPLVDGRASSPAAPDRWPLIPSA